MQRKKCIFNTKLLTQNCYVVYNFVERTRKNFER